MRLGVIAQLRNEADIVPLFLAALDRLFDHAILMDHGSSDGTFEALQHGCAARGGWSCWDIAVPGHHQAAFATFALHHMFATTACDHVLFLDGDEFLDVDSRAELEHRLGTLRGPQDVGHLVWKNCVPDRLDGSFLDSGLAWVPASRSSFGKVLIPRPFYEASAGRISLWMGNHLVDAGNGLPINLVDVGDLLHLPVRSARQIAQKAVLGTLADSLRLDRGPRENVHWREIVAQVARGALTDDELVALATRYGEPATDRPRMRMADLPVAGYTRRRIPIGRTRPRRLAAGHPDPWQLAAAALVAGQPLDGAAIELELRGSRLTLKDAPDPPPMARMRPVPPMVRDRWRFGWPWR